mmetsp:Transcript_9255/g.19753  ORF Transcript_9255/g.19753 Transcript_9255/m.19753 type:complete len:105 (+) Transcript_9255:107-421(+)
MNSLFRVIHGPIFDLGTDEMSAKGCNYLAIQITFTCINTNVTHDQRECYKVNETCHSLLVVHTQLSPTKIVGFNPTESQACSPPEKALVSKPSSCQPGPEPISS